MSDPNIVDFYSRISRIERGHSKGMGFEATGTLGRSHYHRPARKHRLSLLLPAVFIIAAALGLKAAIYLDAGAAAYQQRVDQLLAGQGIDRVGGLIMQVDPVTVFLSEQIARGLLLLETRV